jgi:ABC-type nitrate/sulfonate/bicarbonate transport system permease component
MRAGPPDGPASVRREGGPRRPRWADGGGRGDWVTLAVLALAWQAAVQAGWLRSAAFPAPSAILATLAGGLAAGSHPLLQATLRTLASTALGYGLAAVVGVALGSAMGLSPWVAAVFDPLVALALPLPEVVTIPVLALWLRGSETVVIVVVAFSACLPVLKAAQTGVRALSRQHAWAARSLGAGAGFVFWRVTLPGSLVHLLPGLRVAMGYAWRAVVAAEFITLARSGLGASIFAARQFDDVPVMYAALILIGLLGFALERGVLGGLERATLGRWGLLAR